MLLAVRAPITPSQRGPPCTCRQQDQPGHQRNQHYAVVDGVQLGARAAPQSHRRDAEQDAPQREGVRTGNRGPRPAPSGQYSVAADRETEPAEPLDGRRWDYPGFDENRESQRNPHAEVQQSSQEEGGSVDRKSTRL